MKNWIVVFIAAFLFFSGCQKEEVILPQDEFMPFVSNAKNVTVGEEIYLEIGESVLVKPDGFTITFKEVTEDSRCPTDANCIWEGRAATRLIVENREHSHDIILETPNSQQMTGQSVNLFGRTIRLRLVAPYPTAEHCISPKEYRILLLVTDLEDIGPHR